MGLARQDVEILKLLQRDSTISTASIAEKINLSQSPCWRRINRLEQEGLIRGGWRCWTAPGWAWRWWYLLPSISPPPAART
nr:Lrp/AsnC family transcriptional regulator [Kineobactrum salinum]